MGTCLSKKKESSTDTTKKKPNLKQDPALVAPPPPSLSPPLPEEEAVVKEVLTEIPLPSSAITRSNSRKAPEDPTTKSSGEVEAAATVAPDGDDDGSEDASEIYSASECFSASTALTEKRSVGAEEAEAEAGEEETSAPPKWWPPEWSSPGGQVYHHQRRRSTPGESPARRDPRASVGGGARSSPSPVRRAEGRPFPGNGNAAAGMWKPHGDRSGRRSVSPAAKRVPDAARAGGGGVSRSSSMKKTATASTRRPRPADATAGSSVRRAAVEGGEEELPPSPRQESVENPFVSLECFIFL